MIQANTEVNHYCLRALEVLTHSLKLTQDRHPVILIIDRLPTLVVAQSDTHRLPSSALLHQILPRHTEYSYSARSYLYPT